MVAGDCGVDQLAAMGFERRQRAHFIDAHQPAVTGDIGSENGRKPALGGLSFHERLPPAPYSVRRTDYLPLTVERQSISWVPEPGMRLLRVCPQNSNWSLFRGVADVPGIDLKALWGHSHEIGSASRFDG
jgi:hypothetical protein